MLPGHDPEHLLDTALSALSADGDWRAVLDELPVPVYFEQDAPRQVRPEVRLVAAREVAWGAPVPQPVQAAVPGVEMAEAAVA